MKYRKTAAPSKVLRFFFAGWFYKMIIFFEPLCKYKLIFNIYCFISTHRL